jgi:hypothetical protein
MFEKIEEKYEIGDFVHLNLGESWTVYPDVKILGKHSKKNDYYYIESQLKVNNSVESFWINSDDIERKSTDEEVVRYKLRMESNKYNI